MLKMFLGFGFTTLNIDFFLLIFVAVAFIVAGILRSLFEQTLKPEITISKVIITFILMLLGYFVVYFALLSYLEHFIKSLFDIKLVSLINIHTWTHLNHLVIDSYKTFVWTNMLISFSISAIFGLITGVIWSFDKKQKKSIKKNNK